MRHSWNLRRKPLDRPHRLQRLHARTANFGFFNVLATHADVATVRSSLRQFLRNGMPKPARRALPSSSVLAVVTMQTFMPLTF